MTSIVGVKEKRRDRTQVRNEADPGIYSSVMVLPEQADEFEARDSENLETPVKSPKREPRNGTSGVTGVENPDGEPGGEKVMIDVDFTTLSWS